MNYRSLLVHIDDSDQSGERLDVAARLARKFDAELAGAYLVPTRELTPFTSAMLPDALVEHRLHESGDAQALAEARFRAAADREGLLALDWSAPAGRPIDAAISHARYSDIAILGQPQPADAQAAFANDLVRSVLMASGRPVLIVPHFGEFAAIGETVLIAWKESRESARAVADALPFLQRAAKVVVMSISAPGDQSVREMLADSGIAAFLQRHDIAAEVRHEVAEDIDAGNLLLSRAADLAADLIVMGAYSRPRLSEFVLGGVTRVMLQTMTVPVLMSH
ncbi:MAG: universal stress protein [Casimicrobiaceae bacterium]